MTARPDDSDPALAELTRRIGGHVRALRRARGLSRRVLSEISGVSERYLAQLESGNGNVTVGILHRLSLVFGCAVEDLVAGGARPNTEKATGWRFSGCGVGVKPRLARRYRPHVASPSSKCPARLKRSAGWMSER